MSNSSEVRKMSVDTREPRNMSVPLVGSQNAARQAADELVDDDFEGLVSSNDFGLGGNNNKKQDSK